MKKGEKTMKLHTYTNEILDIAKSNDVSWDIGADMFLSNVRNSGVDGLPFYKGADGVDFKGLQAEYENLHASKTEFIKDYRANQSEIIKLWKIDPPQKAQIKFIMEKAGDCLTPDK